MRQCMHSRRGDDQHGLLAHHRYGALADALGDTPYTAIDLHHLRRGTCRVYLAGVLPDFGAAIIQIDDLPQEVDGYGHDPAALVALLAQVPGWDCVLVDAAVAEPLSALLEVRTGCRVRHYGDIAYHLPHGALIPHEHPDVRLLDASDLPLFAPAPGELQGGGFGRPEALLDEGYAAGAIVEGQLVALVHTSAITSGHGDIGAYCLPAYRGRGYVTAAASLVAERLRDDGRIPIWSTGENNWASQRVAVKLGFEVVGQRVYLIPRQEQEEP